VQHVNDANSLHHPFKRNTALRAEFAHTGLKSTLDMFEVPSSDIHTGKVQLAEMDCAAQTMAIATAPRICPIGPATYGKTGGLPTARGTKFFRVPGTLATGASDRVALQEASFAPDD